MLHNVTVVHAYSMLFEHMAYQLAGHENSFVHSPPLLRDIEGKKSKTVFTTSMTMTRTISFRESCCLANCRPLHVSAHHCLVFVQSVQEVSVHACS